MLEPDFVLEMVTELFQFVPPEVLITVILLIQNVLERLSAAIKTWCNGQ